MPGAGAFARAFGIVEQRLVLAGYRLVSKSIGYVPVVKYRRYEYPIELVFEVLPDALTTADPKKLVDAVARKTANKKQVRTRYKNPYRCRFGQPSLVLVSGQRVTVGSLGKAVRVYD